MLLACHDMYWKKENKIRNSMAEKQGAKGGQSLPVFFLRLQNSDDLAVLLGMIRAMTDQSLTGVGCYPLTLLQEAEQSERAVAFYRDGVIAVSLDLIRSIWPDLM